MRAIIVLALSIAAVGGKEPRNKYILMKISCLLFRFMTTCRGTT